MSISSFRLSGETEWGLIMGPKGLSHTVFLLVPSSSWLPVEGEPCGGCIHPSSTQQSLFQLPPRSWSRCSGQLPKGGFQKTGQRFFFSISTLLQNMFWIMLSQVKSGLITLPFITYYAALKEGPLSHHIGRWQTECNDAAKDLVLYQCSLK